MPRTVLTAHDITKSYIMGGDSLEVLRGVDLELREGEILAIVGESGAGKSTLLHILGMLDRPTTGTLTLDGREITRMNDTELAFHRNRTVGFIFQFHHLLPEFTSIENVIMPAFIAGNKGDGVRERAEYLLGRVGLSKRLSHRPGELSGGELQRVAVARALMNAPSLVLADEPSGNLDYRNSLMLHELILDLAREQSCTFIIVTHDLSLAGKADRVVLLQDGVAVEDEIKKIAEQLLMKSV